MGKQRRHSIGDWFRRLIFSRRVLLPAVAATPFLLFQGWDSPFGLGLLGVSALGIAWHLTFGRERMKRLALGDVLERQRREHIGRLKSVRRLLRRDRDPRSSKLVKQLKVVFDRLWVVTPDPIDEQTQPSEIHMQILALHEASLKMLEKSFEIWRQAQRVRTDRTKHQLLNSRDELLDQVGLSIEHLEKSLDELQLAKLERQDTDWKRQSSRLLEELDQSLTVARNVETRMEDLDQRLRQIEQE